MVLKKIRKKAVIFTIISIVISSIILSAFFFEQKPALNKDVTITKLRIKNINKFIEQTDTLLKYQIEAQTKLAINNTINKMIEENTYIENPAQEELTNCLIKGELKTRFNTRNFNCGANLTDIIVKLNEFSLEKLNINSNFSIKEIKIYQQNPWNITTEANITLEIRDSYAYWNITKIIKTDVSIIGFQDPTHIIGVVSPAKQQNITIKTDDPFTGWERYPSTLNSEKYKYNQLYFHYNKAPNFLSRLSGNLNARDTTGIAVIVNQTIMTEPQKTKLDYYFMRQTNVCNEPVIFNFFKQEVTPAERSRLGISENPSEPINGLVFPKEFLEFVNMGNPAYYEILESC